MRVQISTALLTTFLFVLPSVVFANEYAQCGLRVNVIKRYFTDSEKIRVQCINDVYDRAKKAKEDELNSLHEMVKNLEVELKATAYDSSVGLVRCSPPKNYSGSPDPARTKKCQELVESQNAILKRIDVLNGWEPKAATVENPEPATEPPCPTGEELRKIEQSRYFNKKLLQTYERCVVMAQ